MAGSAKNKTPTPIGQPVPMVLRGHVFHLHPGYLLHKKAGLEIACRFVVEVEKPRGHRWVGPGPEISVNLWSLKSNSRSRPFRHTNMSSGTEAAVAIEGITPSELDQEARRIIWRATLALVRRRKVMFQNGLAAAFRGKSSVQYTESTDGMTPVATEPSGLRLYLCRGFPIAQAVSGARTRADREAMMRPLLVGIGRNGKVVEIHNQPEEFHLRIAAARYRTMHSAQVPAAIAATAADPLLQALASEPEADRPRRRRM